MRVQSPKENFPEVGTVANPAALYDGDDAFVCYEASGRMGGGNVVLKFNGDIDFRITPMTVEGLGKCRYPVKPWAFNEVIDVEETDQWKALNPRLWLMSFNDVMIEILFETVSLITHGPHGDPQHKTLVSVLR
ncbi:hypothetical protein [Mycoplana sp. MJR14]|uniref:hypothetical protein n=1 Tax=Mycoplana sp. MJR14 TaxID=3032583 RepID=UPI0023DA4C6F|nr:hypothetical protein [Mycoplana sp. MJR14]MDF1635129.1 hypothetical protein [Mycoplana sp. MJR14]